MVSEVIMYKGTAYRNAVEAGERKRSFLAWNLLAGMVVKFR